MDEAPKQKVYNGINLKHYSLKDRRNIEDKLAKGIPVHQIKREYKPEPRKAQRPKNQTNFRQMNATRMNTRRENGWQPNMRPRRHPNVSLNAPNMKGPNTKRANMKGPNTKGPNMKGQASRRKNPKPKVRSVFRVEPVALQNPRGRYIP
jgi:hypothetical protein